LKAVLIRSKAEGGTGEFVRSAFFSVKNMTFLNRSIKSSFQFTNGWESCR
jgi:hypothetical protein